MLGNLAENLERFLCHSWLKLVAKIIAFVLRYRAKFLPKFKLNRCVFPLCIRLLRLKSPCSCHLFHAKSLFLARIYAVVLFELNKFGSCGVVISCCVGRNLCDCENIDPLILRKFVAFVWLICDCNGFKK